MKIAWFTADTDNAKEAYQKLSKVYDAYEPEDADVIVALGGDGSLLHALHKYMSLGKPIFGMNRGSVGFLLNEYRENNLIERIEKAHEVELHPLHMHVTDIHGRQSDRLAINEVSLLRETHQTANIKIIIDDVVRMEELMCDGIMVSTPAGSTAYNFSAHGPIIPLNADLLALTPISAFRPRRWRGALLPHDSRIKFEILQPENRPVSAVADFNEIRDTKTIEVWEDHDYQLKLLFDCELNLDERIRKEQFMP